MNIRKNTPGKAQSMIKMDPLEFDFSRLEPWKEALFSVIGELMSARLKQNVTQQELADRMNIPQSVISRFEHAGRIPTFEFLFRVAKALDMKLLITAYGDRTIILSREHTEKLSSLINSALPDLYSVVSDLIDKSNIDIQEFPNLEDAEEVNEYRFEYTAETDIFPIAAEQGERGMS